MSHIPAESEAAMGKQQAEDERAYLRCCAQDLQKQLDAHRARQKEIAEQVAAKCIESAAAVGVKLVKA